MLQQNHVQSQRKQPGFNYQDKLFPYVENALGNQNTTFWQALAIMAY